MLLTRNCVELLAPAGTWDALVAAVEAGADAVYLGGKHFNMRMHHGDTNFDDEMLKKAVDFTHEHGVKLYITLNNLISEEELPALREYLLYLQEIRPDAILVQDFAVLELKKELGIDIPLHTSVMMNTHNEAAIEKLKEYGITRIVVGREMTLSELSLFKERTGLEVEYFMHGAMCMSESGQCIQSGVLFGQSGNRGRCLKPCRWAYELIDEATGEVLDAESEGPYKLALKDMCMYRNIPELIQAGVHSFKIEGRMRPAEFIRRIVRTYRKAIDSYIADPFGYQVDEAGWHDLFDNRARDFTTTFALGPTTARDIGFDGTREPRFFSEAVKEPGFQDDILKTERPIARENAPHRRLAVRVGDIEGARAAIESGARTSNPSSKRRMNRAQRSSSIRRARRCAASAASLSNSSRRLNACSPQAFSSATSAPCVSPRRSQTCPYRLISRSTFSTISPQNSSRKTVLPWRHPPSNFPSSSLDVSSKPRSFPSKRSCTALTNP